MSFPIPQPQKPIQLYLWPQCGFCVKQSAIVSSMDAEMTNWFNRNVQVTHVHDPKMHPMIKSYPYWVISGKPDPGFKTMDQIVSMRHAAP